MDLRPMFTGAQQVQISSNLSSSGKRIPDRMPQAMAENTAKGKKITNEDLEEVMAMNVLADSKAINKLVEKSPIGFVRPTADELCENGYTVSMNGDEFTGPGGNVTMSMTADGLEQFTYKTDRVKQDMIYDANGNAKSGRIIISDKFGVIERRLDFIINEDGKMKAVYLF